MSRLLGNFWKIVKHVFFFFSPFHIGSPFVFLFSLCRPPLSFPSIPLSSSQLKDVKRGMLSPKRLLSTFCVRRVVPRYDEERQTRTSNIEWRPLTRLKIRLLSTSHFVTIARERADLYLCLFPLPPSIQIEREEKPHLFPTAWSDEKRTAFRAMKERGRGKEIWWPGVIWWQSHALGHSSLSFFSQGG